MKTKTIIFATMMSLALGLFVACSSDEDSDEVLLTNEKLLKSELGKSTIAPLNTIPASVRAKASEEELAVFEELAKNYSIDYSFVNSFYYQTHKKEILCKIEERYSKQKSSYENSTLVFVMPDQMVKIGLKAAPTEQGSFYYNNSYNLFECGNIVLSASISVIVTPYNAHVDSFSASLVPYGATISQVVNYAEENGVLVIAVPSCTITYGNQTYNVPAKAIQINLFTGDIVAPVNS